MARRDIIVVGASAGGVEALRTLAHALPSGFPAAVFAVLHFPEGSTSTLPRILSRVGALSAVHAVDGDRIVPGRIYIAPPDRYLLLTPKSVRLARGPTRNGNRPAIDPLFRSAAVAFGPRVIGVVLTGGLDDGTSGLAAVKRYGGLAVVQDPEDARFPSMPRSAIEHVAVDRVVPVQQLTSTLLELIDAAIPNADFADSRDGLMENEFGEGNLEPRQHPVEHPGKPSIFGCPDCGGEQEDRFDEAMRIALRTLEERAALSRQMAERHRRRGADGLALRFEDQAASIDARAAVVRSALIETQSRAADADEEHDGPRRAS